MLPQRKASIVSTGAVWCVLVLGTTCVARAHFVFLVPDSSGTKAAVVLSEDLEPDAEIEMVLAGKPRLKVRDAAGKETELTLSKTADDTAAIELPGEGLRVVYGTADLGLMQRGEGPAFRLVYHPKTIVGDAFDARVGLGDRVPVELVPVGSAGAVAFRVMAGGKPVAQAEVNLVLPDGERTKVTTGENGQTKTFAAPGRYAAWTRHFEPKGGEVDGKPYQSTRHYATLVADVGQANAMHGYADMPVAASSFGAVGSDGWLYIYGGHIARVHTYSTEAVSKRFARLKLSDGRTWEELPSGPGLQGMNLAAWDGKIYRVGGMQPRNKPGDPTDNYSIADVERFDPAVGKWQSLPSLPVPRSSHDVAVVDGKLYVIGGWNMRGEDGEDWLDKALVLDLKADAPTWQEIDQPFQRRALIVTVHDGKIFVIGGFNEDNVPERRVDVYDPAQKTWSTVAELPGQDHNGFAPAACTLGGRVYASVADGSLLRLDTAGKKWDLVTKLQPRIVHRLIPHGAQLLLVGGARGGDNLASIEAVTIDKATGKIASINRD
ncbi:MAG TPA: kelch repeat-containing protein [Gemmataceae bacterium]|nr:kelch repeat-containing protein [Gemmataceae bacterium]